jgi:phospholipid/cholesterol/gamma-HCH transport system permease protein
MSRHSPIISPSRLSAFAARELDRRANALADVGWQLAFYGRTVASAPRAVRRYPRETLRLLSEVCFGTGGLAVIGGTLGVMIGMTTFTGAVVGLQGYSALRQLGTAALTGFISAYFNTREVAPLSAGLAPSWAQCASPRRWTRSR